ncbi:uncharacterized protein PRCAT00006319001 [Priceomyces carsonii]|uniref:uncharacterized protein n=1 Tax=Priceomyces carsonii TaxID=28549 RepID=UPI002EDAD2A5|nr:unnamed protein product [Priceomyces carsonii]
MTKEDKKGKKRRKINKEESSKRLQCGFFLVKKNRKCAMQRKEGNQFCSEHMIFDKEERKRIPCPLDPKHTVWKDDLDAHLKKCNAKLKEKEDEWFQRDINCSLKNNQNEFNVKEYEDDKVESSKIHEKYIHLLEGIEFEPLIRNRADHKGLQAQLSKTQNQKHALQQSSLIGNLKEKRLLDTNCTYIEFGCGKGELSRYVNLCLIEELKEGKTDHTNHRYGYGFIDRGVNRLKADNRILKDVRESSVEFIAPMIKRTRIDIKDLNLDRFLELLNPHKVVGISKHLCGAATDLTLKLVLNSSLVNQESKNFGGLLIAMCCRHACSYDELLPQSREFLKQKGFRSPASFNVLRKAASWAVSHKISEGNGNESEAISNDKRKLGLKARRLIDESRVFAMKQLLPNFEVDMFLYTDTDVTLENVCLCVRPL